MSVIVEEEQEDELLAPQEEEWKDVLGSGAVLKRTLRPALAAELANASPDYKQQVLVHMVGRVSSTGREFLNTRTASAGAAPVKAYVGEPIMDALPPGVMLCLRTMHVGEICRIKLQSRYAYALGGHWYGLEPETDVEMDVELVQVGDYLKEVPEQSAEELKETMREFKDRGNDYYKWNELNKALRCYKEGVRYGDGLFGEQGLGFDPETGKLVDEEAYKDRVACISNIAAVLEKQGKLAEAMESTVLALTADPSHLKSLARATRIAIAQGSHEEALAAVQVALDLAPTNAAILKLQRDLLDKMAQHRALEKQRYGGFLKPVSADVAAKLREEQAANRQLEQLEQAAQRLKEDQAAKQQQQPSQAREELEEESTPRSSAVEEQEEEEEEDALATEKDEEEEEEPDVEERRANASSSSFEDSPLWKLFVLLFPTLFVLLAMAIPRLMK